MGKSLPELKQNLRPTLQLQVNQRKSARVHLETAILVKGLDVTRGAFSEISSTVNVSVSGALILLRSRPAKGDHLTLINLSNQQKANAVVVDYKSMLNSEHFEYVVRLLQPTADFWGIRFEEAPSDHAVTGLVLCTRCLTRHFSSLSLEEYLELTNKFSFHRNCPDCLTVTTWTVFSSDEEFVRKDEHPAGNSGSSTTAGDDGIAGAEKRGSVRYAIQVPVHIIGPSGSLEATITDDLSSTGMMFSSSENFEIGASIQAIFGYEVSNRPPTSTCRVMRRARQEGSRRFRYGVLFESLQHRQGRTERPMMAAISKTN